MEEGKTENLPKASKAVRVEGAQKKGKKVGSKAYKTTSEEKINSMVEEADGTAYVTSKRQISTGINNWVILDNASKKPESRMTSFEKIDIIREGISKKDLEHLKEKTELDYNQLSKVLSVARATLINKKGAAKFDMVLSERIVGVADIYSYGYEVFEDENRFNEWIFRSNQSLGGQAPYDLLDNQYGREEVKNLIGRIDYGVYS
jgi:putative toxin-antitoxin system antitoxin component (TIGR02293 family)